MGDASAIQSPFNLFGSFFALLQKEMALGFGDENINSIPAVQLHQLGTDRLCGNGQPGEGNQAPCAIFPEPNNLNAHSPPHLRPKPSLRRSHRDPHRASPENIFDPVGVLAC